MQLQLLQILMNVFYYNKNDNNLNQLCCNNKPFQINININTQTSIYSLLVCDIIILNKPNNQSNNATESLTSEYVLYLTGDTEGYLHYAICNQSLIITDGKLLCYNNHSNIESILSNGDSMKPYFYITMNHSNQSNQSNQSKNNSQNEQSMIEANSNIITISNQCEIKIWKLIFIYNNNHSIKTQTQIKINQKNKLINQKSIYNENNELLFNNYEIKWQLIGLFNGIQTINSISMVTSIPTPVSYLPSFTCATLDPTCNTIIIATSNGMINQWYLPNNNHKSHNNNSNNNSNNNNNENQLLTIIEPFYQLKSHNNKITEIRLWNKNKSIDISQANTRTTHTMSENEWINSSLMTSSLDYSIILYKFINITINNQLNIQLSLNSNIKYYLKPQICRKFMFSFVPKAGLCYYNHMNDLWYIDVILNNTILTVMKGSDKMLFENINNNQTNNKIQTENNHLNNNISRNNSNNNNNAAAVVEVEVEVDEMLLKPIYSMAVSVTNIIKPLRLLETINKIYLNNYSWNILNYWTNKHPSNNINN